jgi:hypothetical protein
MKEAYKKFQAKYKLPEYDMLSQEFELYTLEHEDYLLKSIVKLMIEKLEGYSKFIDEIFHTESNIATMHMANSLEADDKKRLNEIFRRLQYWNMNAVRIDLAYDEKDCAKYIIDLNLEWQGMKGDLLRIMEKLRDSWLVEPKKSEEARYFG